MEYHLLDFKCYPIREASLADKLLNLGLTINVVQTIESDDIHIIELSCTLHKHTMP